MGHCRLGIFGGSSDHRKVKSNYDQAFCLCKTLGFLLGLELTENSVSEYPLHMIGSAKGGGIDENTSCRAEGSA